MWHEFSGHAGPAAWGGPPSRRGRADRQPWGGWAVWWRGRLQLYPRADGAVSQALAYGAGHRDGSPAARRANDRLLQLLGPVARHRAGSKLVSRRSISGA